jgi:hypothetical protein
MVGHGRLGVWLVVLIADLLLAIAAVAGTHFVLATRESDGPQDGFLAYGLVTVAISGSHVNTPQTKRCIASSVQAGIDVRQGTPVLISLDGRAVGGGDLSTGELIQEMTQRAHLESSRASCRYKFSAPVTRPGEGQYTLDIGDAKIAFSVDELRNGIVLELT